MFVRKAAKSYGTCRVAEGADVSGARITLIEDVITTGGAVRAATLALRELGGEVGVTVCAIDRSQLPGGPLLDLGVATRAVLTKDDLDRAGLLHG